MTEAIVGIAALIFVVLAIYVTSYFMQVTVLERNAAQVYAVELEDELAKLHQKMTLEMDTFCTEE